LESRKHREFKLALPLHFEVRENEIIIKDKFENTSIIPNDSSVSFGQSYIDDDGYVRFDISFVESRKPKQTILPQTEAHLNGFTLLCSNLTNSFGYGGKKSTFEYYKRSSDLSYYLLVKKEGRKDRKLQLGSLCEPNSRIFQVACIINKQFSKERNFDKYELTQFLPPPLKGPRIIKGTLDILTKEGYLTNATVKSGKKNRDKEVFTKTENLEKYMSDPRPWQKPNGFNIGSLTTTSNLG
jgi:hypothetical protein